MDCKHLAEAEQFQRSSGRAAVCDDRKTSVVTGTLGQFDQQRDSHGGEEVDRGEIDDQCCCIGFEEVERLLFQHGGARHIDLAGDRKDGDGALSGGRESHMRMCGKWIVHRPIMQDRAVRCEKQVEDYVVPALGTDPNGCLYCSSTAGKDDHRGRVPTG